MSYDRVFIDTVDKMMKENGFFRINKVYYRWIDIEQIVISFSYEMLNGSREYRLLISLNAYVDCVSSIEDSVNCNCLLLDYGFMNVFNQTLNKKNGRSVVNDTRYNSYRKYTEEQFMESLKDTIEFIYNEYLLKMFCITDILSLFKFKNYVNGYVYENGIYSDISLLFEALQLDDYKYALSAVNYFIHNFSERRIRMYNEKNIYNNREHYMNLWRDRIQGIDKAILDLVLIKNWIESADKVSISRVLDERIHESKVSFEKYFSQHKPL